jgi:3-carboxy-cis,cis-muconate cycloisomerase
MAIDSTSASRAPAKLSSSPYKADLFGGTYARGGAAEAVTGDAWLAAMLDAEAALARACAGEGLISAAAAEAVASACAAADLDVAAIARAGAEHATPVVPLVAALRDAVGAEHRDAVHLGATSQDILDTAAMLVAKRALVPLLADAGAAADAAALLAGEHRDTPMAGRTLLQQALPTTFGLRAAGWLTALDAARARLAAVRDGELAVQMGGPVGTRAAAVSARVAVELELADPVIPWPTDRGRVAALAGALGGLAGSLAKVARDVTLLAQDEIGEVREGGGADRGGSSAMAHKRNPVAAVSVLACAARVPGLASTILSGMDQEHERAAGAWQAEWGTLSDLLSLTGSAAAWGRDLLEGLEVDPARMGENLARLGQGDDPGAAAELVDRALAAHRSAP